MTEKLSTEIRQTQIIEAALQILGDRNIKKLNITDIAHHLGLAPSALYRHFKGIDAIINAILELIRTKLHKNLETVRQESDDAIQRLHSLLLRHTQLIKEQHGIPRIIFSDELWGQRKESRMRMYRIVNGYLMEIEDIIKEGQDAGRIRSDITARTAAKMFFGIIQPAALLWHMSEGEFDIDGHTTEVWPVFEKIIK